VTAVVVPIVGAALWERLGYQFPFLFGTAFIFVSLWLTRKIDVERQRTADGPPVAVEGATGREPVGQVVEPPASGQPRLDRAAAAVGRE
jgi:hypothetical protein